MSRTRRREFLADVGRGMLLASIGPCLAEDLGLATAAMAAEGAEALSFGAREPLVALMQETSADRLLPELVAAAALANARTFGGQHYEGYHTIMAMAPAYHMARELPEDRRALPVLKVLYRNAHHIQHCGGRAHEALHPVEAAALPEGKPRAEALRELMRGDDMEGAERAFAGLAGRSPEDAYNDLLYLV